MMKCAYRQGHGPAAYKFGIGAEIFKDFAAMLAYYQAGTKFGNASSAAALMLIYDTKEWGLLGKSDQEALRKLELVPDPERERRYEQISQALDV